MTTQLVFRQDPPPALDSVWWARNWPSRLDRKLEAIEEVQNTLIARGQVAEDDLHWLMLCLDEAVTNAMLHGNEGDHTVPIAIQVGTSDGRWVVVVSDQGDGFLPEAIPDCENPDNLLLEHGRGIRLMLEWLDQLIYFHGSPAIHPRTDHHVRARDYRVV
jgi:serine/threonine-protein kinase RsbW